MMSALLLAVYVTITAYITVKIITSWNAIYRYAMVVLTRYLMTIRHVEGHVMPGAPIKWKSYFDDVNFFGRDFSRVYGRIYHVWHRLKPVVVLADVDAIRSFYRDHFSHKREPDFSCCGPAIKDLLGESVGIAHGRDKVKAYRGHFESFFSAASIHSLHPIIGQATDAWVASLPVGESLDLNTSGLTSVPLIALMCVTYGDDITNRHLPEMRRLLQLHNEAVVSSGYGLMKISFSMFRKLLPNWSSAKMHKFLVAWESFHEKLLQERRDCKQDKAGGEKHVKEESADGIFFRLHDHIEAGVVNLSHKQLLHTVDEILLFNVDISLAAASFLLQDISRYPHVQHKLQQEVDDVIGDLDPATITDIEIKLPYLHMVVKESARMHPALGVTFPEMTVKEVTDMAGFQVPKDTIVCIDPHSVNYDATYWPEPETFDPERFAEGRSHVPYSFFRFGLGPRKCLGYRLAQSIVFIVVVKLLQQFCLESSHDIITDGDDVMTGDRHSDSRERVRVKKEGMPFFTPYLSQNIVIFPRK